MDVKFNDFSLLREHGWKGLISINAKQYRALNGLLLPNGIFWLLLCGVAGIAGLGVDALLDSFNINNDIQGEISWLAMLVLGAYPFWKTLQLLLWSFKLIVWRIHDFGFTAKWLIALYFLIAIIFGGASEATTIVMDLFMGMLVAFPFVMLFFMSSKEGSSKYECVDDGEVQPTKFILVMAWLMVMITLASNLFSFVGEGL